MSLDAAHTHLAAPFTLTRNRPTVVVHARQTEDILHGVHLPSTLSKSTKMRDAGQLVLRRQKQTASITTHMPSLRHTKARSSTVPCPTPSRSQTRAAAADIDGSLAVTIETATQTLAASRPVRTAIAMSNVVARGAEACTRTPRRALPRQHFRRMQTRKGNHALVAGDGRIIMRGMKSAGVGPAGAGELAVKPASAAVFDLVWFGMVFAGAIRELH